MGIKRIQSAIIDWEQNEGKYHHQMGVQEKPVSYFLIPHRDNYGSVFHLEWEIYLTSELSDLIINIQLKSVIEFDTGGKPVTNELYELYQKSRFEWVGLILNRSIKDVRLPLFITSPPYPFELMEVDLQTAINQAYPD